MQLTRKFSTIAIIFSLSILSSVTLSVQTTYGQTTKAALQRGYRTGYSDGYMAGYRDSIDNAARNIADHTEFVSADRAYNKDYGSLTDYRDGYRQGFESGYNTGFEKRSFESTVPTGLTARGLSEIPKTVAPIEKANPVVEREVSREQIAQAEPQPEPQQPAAQKQIDKPVQQSAPSQAAPIDLVAPIKASFVPESEAIIIIPRDTELILEIQDDLSTENNREGDKFTARIVSPVEIEGALIEGRVERITKPGRIKRRSEMLLSFDRIILTEERWSNFDAILTEVMPVKGDNIKTIDPEGSAIGKRTLKEDAIKVGASTGAGLGIGALTGGPVGAAVGAGVGAAFGVGAVVIERGKHIRLNKNQQLRIRTSYETKIR
ncbi:MAG: hypothetical protein KF685_05830 [Acidobacteria bacterium]|nr:hypothetical protein [Acidobacteriota bacterium]